MEQELERILASQKEENKPVNYNELISILIESIKQQQKQIDALKEKIDSIDFF